MRYGAAEAPGVSAVSFWAGAPSFETPRCARLLRMRFEESGLTLRSEGGARASRRVEAFAGSHDVIHRAMPERAAVRPAAVPAGGGADAGVRHHGSRQPGARLTLHDRRLLRRHVRRMDRQLCLRRGARARSYTSGRHGCRSGRHATALRPRSPRPRARHVRPDFVFRRAGAADLGAGRDDVATAIVAQPIGPDHSGRRLLGLQTVDHRRDARRRRHFFMCW